MKIKNFLFIMVMLTGILSASTTARADDLLDDNKWDDKLGRGVLNIVSSPVELARNIYVRSHEKGAGYGWTMGLVEGIGRMFLRLGAGAIETVTFPFDFPTEDKSPLLEPEFAWQTWDVV